MIEASHLTKRYGDRVAVDDVSFHVLKGEIVGFLGPNGAGKSTTLRMVTGFLAPTRGSVRIDELDSLSRRAEAQRRVGYMPEAVPLYPELRVTEYLRYRAALKGVPRRRIKSRVDAALELAAVADVHDRIIGQLSKGYRQRVGLADALVADPPILILDEPTAGLDPNQIREIRELIKRFAGEKTVILSTHILPEVEATCSRVLILHKGRLVAEGAPGTLLAEASGHQVLVVEARAASGRLESVLLRVAGVRNIVEQIALRPEAAGLEALWRLRVETDLRDSMAEDIFRAVAQAGLALRELRCETASLEDVFAQLTTSESQHSQRSNIEDAA